MRATCGSTAQIQKKAKDVMVMLGLNETIGLLAMVSSSH